MGNQIRAARGLLRMTMKDLAAASGISEATIIRAESEGGAPRLTAANLAALQRALEGAGLMFLDADESGGPGVRLRRLEGKA